MPKLTEHWKRTLTVIITLTLQHGCPPSRTLIAEALDMQPASTSVGYALGRLCDLGYVRQTYPRGPYVPLRTVDGTALRLVLEEVPA